MGQKADDILHLSKEDKKKYSTTMEKFEAYFIKCQNPILECTKFNMHKQGETELVDEFITLG